MEPSLPSNWPDRISHGRRQSSSICDIALLFNLRPPEFGVGRLLRYKDVSELRIDPRPRVGESTLVAEIASPLEIPLGVSC